MDKNAFDICFEDPSITYVNFPEGMEASDTNSRFVKLTKFNLESGKLAKTVCPYSQRKIILIGTIFGTIVVYERFMQAIKTIYVCDFPKSIPEYFRKMVYCHSSLSHQTLSNILGTNEGCVNIGVALQRLSKKTS